MDVADVTDINDDRLTGVGQGEGLGLGFAEEGPAGIGGVLVVGQLHPIEGEVALAELSAPAGDHRGEERVVLVGFAGVAFTLIPDGAAQGVGDERGDHAVVQAGGGFLVAGTDYAIPREFRHGLGEGLAGGLGCGLLGFPRGDGVFKGGFFSGCLFESLGPFASNKSEFRLG